MPCIHQLSCPQTLIYLANLLTINTVVPRKSAQGRLQLKPEKFGGGPLHGGGASIVQLYPCKHPPKVQRQVAGTTFVRAFFVDKQGQCGSRENCILLENGPTQSLVNRASQRSSLAVREFRTASKERCGRGYNWCVQT